MVFSRRKELTRLEARMIVGIDLGTTNSLIGTFENGRPVLFPNASGLTLTPSVVSFDDNGVIVGEAAKDRLVTHPDRSVATFKRWMGTARETRLGGQDFRPEELSSFVLRSLIGDAEAATGRKVTEAVISVPAYFSDSQRQATRLAAEMAGLKVERLINEPTAAALAYGMQDREGESRFLVFDLGGGTFDVSIVEIFDGVVEVHASAGDNFLGGEDFLDLLMNAAAADLKLDLDKILPSERLQLRRRMELIKRQLSGTQEVVLEAKIGDRDIRWSIDQERFEVLAEPLLARLRSPLERALLDAKLGPDDLDDIVMVGGASRMSPVIKTVTRLLGRLPLRHVNPDEVVAHGAIVASGLKGRDASLREVILTDVSPYTLGTNISRQDVSGQFQGGYFLPLIPRNSTVPVSREEEFWPVNKAQTTITFGIYQGEHPIADKNILLGELKVPIPQAQNAADRGVIARFTYDIDGILQVEARVKATGAYHEIVIERGQTGLSEAEIRERLAKLAAIKVHPREQQENLALMARTERLYEERLEHREMLQNAIMHFNGVLNTQDERQIARFRDDLVRVLSEIDPR